MDRNIEIITYIGPNEAMLNLNEGDVITLPNPSHGMFKTTR